MSVTKLIISYSTKKDLQSSERRKYPTYRAQNLDGDEIWIQYIFDIPVITQKLLKGICSQHQALTSSWAIVCSEKNVNRVKKELQLLYESEGVPLEFSSLAGNELDFWKNLLNSNIPGLTGEKNLRLSFTFSVVNIKTNEFMLAKNNINKKEDVMAKDPSMFLSVASEINSIWEKDPIKRRILLHSFTLDHLRESHEDSILKVLAGRIGVELETLEVLIGQLEQANIVSSGSGFINQENNALEAVKQKVEETYGLNQFLRYRNKNSEKSEVVSGQEFVDLSYGGKKKTYTSIVRGIFTNHLPDIRFEEMGGQGDVFDLHLSEDWHLMVLCHARTHPLNLQDIAMSLVFKMEIQANHPKAESKVYDVVCGPAFTRDAVKHAEKLNVHLLDSFSLLGLNKYLSSLKEERKLLVQKNFPKFFTKPGGYAAVGSGTKVLDGIN